MPVVTSQEWDEFLVGCPSVHVLQSSAWGELKASFGWEAVHLIQGVEGQRLGAQVLFRTLPAGWKLAYLPKGPVSEYHTSQSMAGFHQAWERLEAEIDLICRRKRAVFLKVEPDIPDPNQDDDQSAVPPGFRLSPHAIQPPRTILVELTGSEEHLLGKMKQKTRYNIRLAQKKGVQVIQSADVDQFYRLMEVTGQRDTFAVHSQDYYQRAYDLFSSTGRCNLLLAEYEGELLGGIMIFIQGKRAWYFYGASGDQWRELMAPYLLQWEAMRWSKGRGCEEYDLWGIPDSSETNLEAQFVGRADGLWGVYRFKRGFGGQVSRAAGPWDRVYQPLLYRLYLWEIKRRATELEGFGE